MKSKVKVLITFLLLMTLVLSQVAFANNGNNNMGKGNGNEKSNQSVNNNGDGKGSSVSDEDEDGSEDGDSKNNGKSNAPGQLKKVEKYTTIDSDRIKVNNNNVNFDAPPVIKEGRTLIPVRAVTEALGCEVVWESPKAYIISPDEELIMIFDLSSETVYLAEDWELDELMDMDDDEWEEMEVEIDAPPGLINDRTFVPLRFISETLGLGIGYDSETGMIGIFDSPELDPEEVEIESYDSLPEEIEVDIELNGFTFVGIEGLEEEVDFTTSGALTVTLLEDFIEDIEEKKTKLEFAFENDSTECIKIFKIELEYMDEEPELNPDDAKIDPNDEEFEIEIDMELNGYTLEDIYYDDSTLDEDEDYTLNNDEDEVTLNDSFLETLNVGEHILELNFERGTEEVTLEFEIEVED